MIDAFMCTCARDRLRQGLAQATEERLKQCAGLSLRLVRPPYSDLDFRIRRRQVCEELSRTPVYLVADDDVLPFDDEFALKGLEIMERNPSFGMVMLRPKWVEVNDVAWGENPDIAERGSEVGGLYLIRKGLVTSWPEIVKPEDGWNNWERDKLSEQGLKVGMFRNLWYLHTGVGFSTLWHNDNSYQHGRCVK